jgi:tRNA(Ile)-lysidine synthase
MSSLLERVCRTIERYGLLPPGARVIVAASGGADSTALVCLLREAAVRLRIEVVGLAHFNHRLRGEAADGDERFCRELAARFSLAFEAGRGDVREAARRLGASIEDAGRRLRYEFLDRARAGAGATHVAVGHTRDDQAETVLMNLLRGAGTLGLGGMPVSRDAFVRPLIDCGHRELVEYLDAAGVAFREDESNLDRRHFRNRIRHDLVPVLERIAPAAREALARAAESARADAVYLDELAANRLAQIAAQAPGPAVSLDAAALGSLPIALARRVASLALRQASGGRFVGFDQAERLLALARGTVRGPRAFPGVSASITGTGQLLLVPTRGRGRAGKTETGPPRTFFRKSLSIPGEADLGCGLALSSELRPAGAEAMGFAASVSSGRTAVVDADLVSGLWVRFRRPGDRVRPLGLGGHKKLQDVFVDRRVPRGERDRVPLVVDRDDRIVWVAGHAISEEFRVTGRTRAVVILTLRGEEG